MKYVVCDITGYFLYYTDEPLRIGDCVLYKDKSLTVEDLSVGDGGIVYYCA